MKYLYKFRSMAKDSIRYTERAITEQELYFSNARAFNDPFDCLPVISTEATTEEFKRYLGDMFERRHPYLSRKSVENKITEISKDSTRNHESAALLNNLITAFDGSMSIAGVLSLAKKPDNVLMWSHYADCHQGICLKFKVCEKSGFFTETHDVIYRKERPTFNIITDNIEESGKKALLTKAKFWAYENEVRMVSSKRPPGVYNYPVHLIEGVILGAKISLENRELVKQWIAQVESEIHLYEAVINSKSFGLDIVKI
ncbi:DUF2971 domain-containing protein [Aliivibrio fischeri]|uniref:DUF2971 domain-containing protein n=1 Tax=Aliivibrio fischeri TaxID=668 RepID=UPI0012DA337C|nr:DUF2971 domain-containing protein [Aliivibrio fischeri]MUJ22597.1 DUF2971 domain-containing protein [Aliivibrio fischeri]